MKYEIAFELESSSLVELRRWLLAVLPTIRIELQKYGSDFISGLVHGKRSEWNAKYSEASGTLDILGITWATTEDDLPKMKYTSAPIIYINVEASSMSGSGEHNMLVRATCVDHASAVCSLYYRLMEHFDVRWPSVNINALFVNKGGRPKGTQPDTAERNREIYSAHLQGDSRQQLARAYNLSVDRIKDILKEARRAETTDTDTEV